MGRTGRRAAFCVVQSVSTGLPSAFCVAPGIPDIAREAARKFADIARRGADHVHEPPTSSTCSTYLADEVGGPRGRDFKPRRRDFSLADSIGELVHDLASLVHDLANLVHDLA
jgi:hypothetical protein